MRQHLGSFSCLGGDCGSRDRRQRRPGGQSCLYTQNGRNGRPVALTKQERRSVREAGRRAGAVGVALPGGLRLKRRRVGPDPARVGGGRRGVIQGFSTDSRRRMLLRLQQTDWSAGAVFFVTLTFADDAGAFDDWSHWKYELKKWRQRLTYQYGERLSGAIWKLELAPRKSGENVGRIAPHFHLALFWKDAKGPNMASFRRWCWSAWHSRIDAVRARNTEGIERGKLLSYLAKYMGKLWTLGETGVGMGRTKRGHVFDKATGELFDTGRVWGTWGQPPTSQVAEIELTEAAYIELTRRIAEKGQAVGSWYLGAVSPQWAGFALLGDGDSLLEELCEGIEGLTIIRTGGEP